MSATDSQKPFVAKWGIISTGWIASEFVRDISLRRDDPSSDAVQQLAKGYLGGEKEATVTDVAHAVVAVGSRDKSKAEKFIKEFLPNGATAQQRGLVDFKPEAFGSYDEVFNHPEVSIIYIGTPHQAHYSDAKAALEAGKNVLVEKPATLNAAEWEDLVKIAKQKDLFLMEAVWTRFLPLSLRVQDLVFNQKVIGDVRALFSDFSSATLDSLPDTHRMHNPELAGGALLDLGPYILTPQMLYLYHAPANERSPPQNVTGTMLKHPRTGVDMSTNVTMDYPKMHAKAFLSTSTAYDTPDNSATRIVGSKGEIVLFSPTCKPTKGVVRIKKTEGEGYDETPLDGPVPQFGLYLEADAVARSVRDGEKENKRMPLEETLMTMQIFDKVRQDGGYVYPEGLEKVRLK